MFDIFSRKPEIDVYDTTSKILDDIIGNIELRDVCFSYPTRPDEQILGGFSLIIPSGMTVALVGESGSGKSTVISLIERFYDPQAGEVLIDGINIKEFQLKWIRGKIGLVSQEPVLFASSIRNNITYGKDDTTIEEIRAALELANASKFIDELPEVNPFKLPNIFSLLLLLITIHYLLLVIKHIHRILQSFSYNHYTKGKGGFVLVKCR